MKTEDEILKETKKQKRRNAFLDISGSIFLLLSLIFSLTALMRILKEGNIAAKAFYLVAFVSFALAKFIAFFKAKKKIEKARTLTLFIYLTLLALAIFFLPIEYLFISLIAFAVSIIINRVFKFFRKENKMIAFGIIAIIFALLIIVVAVLISTTEPFLIATVLTTILMYLSFSEIFASSFAQLRLKLLLKIVRKTYVGEITFALLTMIIASSLILSYLEPSMENLGDAFWYCFAVVTTIGFGDFAAVTWVGRILTVILGLFGIILVAVITSIIVNFYNEISLTNTEKKREKND